MFTGIIQEVGSVVRISSRGEGKEIEFSCHEILPELKQGDSVCCNGVCLSVTSVLKTGFKVYAVEETLKKSGIGSLSSGMAINLEPALRLDSRMGGHYVTGHVDGQAVLSSIKHFTDGSKRLSVTLPSELLKYCIAKGSIALNGVSLTIAEISGRQLSIAVIPITLAHTNLGGVMEGQRLNIEVDIMGKYAEKFLSPYTGSSALTLKKLKTSGYHA